MHRLLDLQPAHWLGLHCFETGAAAQKNKKNALETTAARSQPGKSRILAAGRCRRIRRIPERNRQVTVGGRRRTAKKGKIKAKHCVFSVSSKASQS